MKLFAFSMLAVLVMIGLTLTGLANNSPVMSMIGFCSVGGWAFPLLWIAIYRIGQGYSFRVQRRG